jgi:membrane associated rhomboid family serine protease
MGIYDREYYRREGPGFLGSFSERGAVCKWLIGINIVCFLVQLLTATPERLDAAGRLIPASDPFTNALLLDAGRVWHGEVWRLLTHAFLHDPGDVLHLLFNMVVLWMFGTEVEELYGSREFLLFYLTAAVVGGVAFALANLVGFNGPKGLGASAAVTAVLVLAAIHFPNRVVYLFFLIPVPLWLLVVCSVGLDAYALLSGARTGVGVAAHLGGAAFGLAYQRLHLRLSGWLPSGRPGRRVRPRLRLFREEDPTPAPVGVAAQGELDRLREEVDQILEKISLVGKENLTESERQTLLRASELLKRRRG